MGDPRRPHVQHQNKVAFRHNPSSRKTAKILAAPNAGLCTKCHDIIEWRKRYRKYKPLTTPRRCQICDQKKVTRAYHNLCDHCATDTNACAKCRESKSIVNPIITPEQEKADIQLVKDTMGRMTERERRTFLRQIHTPRTAKEKEEDDDEEAYWAKEDEIDFVKAAKFLRERDGQTTNGDVTDDVSDEEEEDEEVDGSRKQKQGVVVANKEQNEAEDNKQTNADPNGNLQNGDKTNAKATKEQQSKGEKKEPAKGVEEEEDEGEDAGDDEGEDEGGELDVKGVSTSKK